MQSSENHVILTSYTFSRAILTGDFVTIHLSLKIVSSLEVVIRMLLEYLFKSFQPKYLSKTLDDSGKQYSTNAIF